jgi:hypothetical protein
MNAARRGDGGWLPGPGGASGSGAGAASTIVWAADADPLPAGSAGDDQGRIPTVSMAVRGLRRRLDRSGQPVSADAGVPSRASQASARPARRRAGRRCRTHSGADKAAQHTPRQGAGACRSSMARILISPPTAVDDIRFGRREPG